MTFEQRLRKLPKAELHVHLRGAMPRRLFGALVQRYGTAGLLERASPRLRALWSRSSSVSSFLAQQRPTEPDLDKLFVYDDFESFLATYALTGYFFRDPTDFRELVGAVLLSLRRQNIVYAEITISLREYLLQGLALPDLLAALDEVRVPGIEAVYLVDFVRDFGVEAAEELLAEILAIGCQRIVGLTLGGSEHRHPPGPFANLYRRAKEAGWRTTIHAGEAAGPESIRESLDTLGVERIGHGIRAIEDPALVERLAVEQIPLEISPTSNVYTGVVPFYHEHPVTKLIAAGVPVSINTDDPTFFHTDLVSEYLHVHDLGVAEDGVLELVRNGFRQGFLGVERRAEYLALFPS